MYISVLSRYLIKTYLIKLLSVLLVLTAALMLAGVFDLLQRIKSVHFEWHVFLQLVCLKIPYLTFELLPMVSMLATFALYFMMAARNELFVIWGAGISIYRVLLPVILLNIVIGIGSITILNPLSTYMLVKYETLEGKFTDRHTPHLTLSNLGIIVAEKYEPENRIYVAKSVIVPEQKMLNVSIFLTDLNNNFCRRIEAAAAYFEENKIILHDVAIFSKDNIKERYPDYTLDSSLKITNLAEGVTAPEYLTLWELPATIYKLSSTGFPTFKHQIYYYKLLFKPLAIITYIFLATCFITGYGRTKNNMNRVAFGILVGILVFLISQIISNILAYTGINIMLAVLAPLIIISLVSNFVILHWRAD